MAHEKQHIHKDEEDQLEDEQRPHWLDENRTLPLSTPALPITTSPTPINAIHAT